MSSEFLMGVAVGIVLGTILFGAFLAYMLEKRR